MTKTVCALLEKKERDDDEAAPQNGATGYTIEGTLTKLSKETKGRDDIYACVVVLSLIEWPKPFLVGRFHGKTKSSVQTGLSEKQARKEAEACVVGAVTVAVNDTLAEVIRRGAPVAV